MSSLFTSVSRAVKKYGRSIVIGGAFGFITAVSDIYLFSRPIKESGLTEGESAIAKALFGEEFDTSGIQKTYYRRWSVCGNERAIACVEPTDRENIRFVMASFFTDDYSLSGIEEAQDETEVFAHELTHVWQLRQKSSVPVCGNYGIPETLISLRYKPFDLYCSEEQAELVGYYTAAFLRPVFNRMSVLPNVMSFKEGCYLVTERHLDLLRETVERRFPHVIAARLESERKADALENCLSLGEKSAVCLSRHYTSMAGKPLTVNPGALLFKGRKKGASFFSGA